MPLVAAGKKLEKAGYSGWPLTDSTTNLNEFAH
jgi:hypothetical protein